MQGNVPRFLPPLILTEAEVDEAMDVLERVFAQRFTGEERSRGRGAHVA